MKISAVSNNEGMREREMKMQRSLWNIKTWLFAVMVTIGMVLGMSAAQAAGIVSGKVYNDVNNDGYYTIGTDFTVDGVTVELQPYGGGTAIATTITSGGGVFSFSGVTTGASANYRIVALTDSSYSAANFVDFSLSAGSDKVDGELLVKGQGGSIAGSLFDDANRNGLFDDGASAGIGAIPIYLRAGTSSTSPIVSTIYTQWDGSYQFQNLPSGVNYVITADADDLDSLGKAVVTTSDATSTQSPIPYLTISSVIGAISGKNIATSEINPNGMDGLVVIDQNGDNAYIPGEDGLLAGATVTLYYEDETTIVPGVAPVTSAENGTYKIANIPLWKYKAKITPPAGYLTSGVSPTSAVVNGKTNLIFVDVAAVAPYSIHNFYVKGDSLDPTRTGISGYVFGYDSNAWSLSPGPDGGGTANNTPAGTRFSNITVDLHDSSGVLVYTQKTKSDGSYNFSGLVAGTYTVKISQADTNSKYGAYVFMNDTDGRSSLRSKQSFEITETLAAASPKTEQNFWFGRNNLGRHGVRAYVQNTNGNSYWSALVYGFIAHGAFLQGTYTLIQEDGTRAKNQDGTDVPDLVLTGKGTDASNASAYFTNQAIPGIYRVIPVSGSYDSSLTHTNSATYFRTNTNAAENHGMPLFRGPNNIRGRLYVDLDGSGAYNGNDIPMGQALVRLYKLKDDGVTNDYEVARMGTKSDGTYWFSYLPDGTYRVVENDLTKMTGGFGDQIQWASDKDEPGAGTAKSFIVSLSSGTAVTDGDILYQSANQDFLIKGKAYLDIYNSGVLNTVLDSYGIGDVLLDGVKVELFQSDGVTPVKDSSFNDVVAYTDASGNYSITGSFLTAGTYVVKASKTHLTVANATGAPGSTRTVVLKNPTDIYEDQVFLLQGPGSLSGFRTYDANGDGNNVGVTTPKPAPFVLAKEVGGVWKTLSANTYQAQYGFLNLEPGTYQVRLSIETTVADKDPDTALGTIQVVVSPTDTSQQKFTNMNFIEDSTFKGTVSGRIRLDANGDGLIDDGDPVLSASDLGGISFDIYRTSLFLTDYNHLTAASTIPVYSTVSLVGGEYSQASVSYGNYLIHIDESALASLGYEVVNNTKGSAPNTSPLTVPVAYPFVNTIGTLQTSVTTANVVNQDFLIRRTSPTEISGRVFYDQDYDNLSSPEDIGLNEMKVILKQSGKEDVIQQVNADGYYKFSSLLDGTYTVVLGSVPNDSDMVAAPTNPASYSITISAGNLVYQDKNFWYNKAGEAGIAGSVMIDINNNHLLDVQSDFPMAGVTVNLKQGASIVKTTTTNSKGAYKFSGIAQDTYTIELVGLPTGYSVYQNVNGPSTASTMPLVMSAGMNSGQWFLLAGDSNTNPGEAPGGTASQKSGISGYLYEGSNGTPTSSRLGGAVVVLYDGSTLMSTYTTGSDGKYQFYNLAASGDYQVVLRTSPSGHGIRGDVDSSTPAGTIDAVVSNSSSNPGKHDQNMWFAALSADGIQGKVSYRASTGPNVDIPLAGLTVELYDKNYPPSVSGNLPIATSTTGSDGSYQFSHIATIDYIVKVKDSEKTTNYYVDLDPAAPGELTIDGLLVAGVADQNFVLDGTQKISGKIWLDQNGDNLYDSGDTLVGSATVTLTMPGTDGALGTGDDIVIRTATTTTDAGAYEFTNLPGGQYQIQIDTTALIFDGTKIIPVADLAGNTLPRDINLTTDQVDVDFGFKNSGIVSGTLYQDIDGDGTKSMVDTEFGGVLVTLTNAANTTTMTTTTLADGTYSFGNVPMDNWKISASPIDYAFSFGEGGTVSGGTVQFSITATSTSATGVNLGYKGTGKIRGKIVMDNDLTDGANATSIDTPVGSAIKVILSGGAGFIGREITANASGEYEISDLAPYTYTVSVKTGAADGFPAGLMVSFDPVNGMTSPSNSVSITVPGTMTLQENKDFGFKGRGGISGKILIDIEGGGTKTAADQPFNGITVTATQGSITRTATTNAAGEYSFETIPTGIWDIYVAASDLPPGYGFSYGEGSPSTAIEVGTDRVKVDIDSALASRATTPTLNAVEVNLGYRGSAAMSGRLIYDNDDTDGAVYNSSIDALFGAGHTVTLSGGTGFTARTTTTNANGEYEFTGLTTYADYKVTVVGPAGYVPSFDPDTTITAPVPEGDGEAVLAITSSNEVKTLQDFGFKGAGKISGKIYIDLNDNGTYQSGIDTAKSGITVTLTHATLPARAATTSASGDYEVTGLAASEWTLEVTGGLSGLRLPSFDYDDSYDPVGSPATPDQAVVLLTTSTPVLEEVDFGYINRGKISGVVKEDMMATGLYDPTAAGISGVTVHLVENDGVTPKVYADGSPVILTTDGNGYFVVRNLDCPPSGETYSVRIEFGPNSTGPLELMEPSYDSDASGAGYGGQVNLAQGTHVVNADLTAATPERTPADLHLGYRQATGDILIRKVAGKPTAKIGDIVPYTITIENRSESPALNVTIEDLIPAGFKYVDGSSRLDGVKIEDPEGNRPLRFEKIDLGGSTGAGVENYKRKLSYFLVVGSGVTQGEYTNSAVAKNQFNKVASNTSQATVEITSDPLFDDSLIFGKVYIDVNGNGKQDKEEEGLGGVKVITARGEIITTDEHGRYHIPAVDGGRWERGRNFILKLDVRSLPAGYKVISENPIVVRTSPGLPNKINFRVQEVNTEEIKEEKTK